MPIISKDGQRIRIPADLAVAALGCGYTVEPDPPSDREAPPPLPSVATEPAPEASHSAASPKAPARDLDIALDPSLQDMPADVKADYAREMRRAMLSPPSPHEDAFLVPVEGPSGPIFAICAACGLRFTRLGGETCCVNCTQRARRAQAASRVPSG